MEIEHGAQGDCGRENDFPVSYLRLMAPPLQLFSAAMWQVVQQGLVDHYGMLEEFVTMVTELVPQLMSYSQRAQLILGLRARLVLELCRGSDPVDLQTIQPHLDRIKAPSSTAKDPHVTIDQVEVSEVNFVELVHTLLDNPDEKAHFFEEVYPEHFGPKYDTALEILVWEFISRLDELLPVPDFTQMVEWLVGVPSFLHDTLQSFGQREDVKLALEHQGNLGQFEEKDPGLLPMDDCILYSLSLSPGARLGDDPASPGSPAGRQAHGEGRSHRGAERARQRREKMDLVAGQSKAESSPAASPSSSLDCGDGVFPPDVPGCPAASPSPPPAAEPSPSPNEDVYIARGGRELRKRKLSKPSEPLPPPSKQSSKRTASLHLEVENSGESPLISIWGEYTDPQASAYPEVAGGLELPESKLPWSDEETLRLLEIWGRGSVQRGLQGCLKNRHIFTLIAQQLAGQGHRRSVEQCQIRIKRLKKAYRRCLKRNKRTSLCKFYEQLSRVLGRPSGSAVTHDPEDDDEEGDEEEEEEVDDEQEPAVKEEAGDEDDDDDLLFLGSTSREAISGARTRSVPWSEVETLALVNIWGRDQVRNGAQRRGPVFPAVAAKMAARGYTRTSEQCQSRLKRLKSSFRQCYENNMKGKQHVECKFYEQLGRVLTTDLAFADAFFDDDDDDDAGGGSGYHMDQDEEEEEEEELELETIPLGAETTDEDLSAAWHQEMGSVERRKVPWSDKETVILLELWGDHQEQHRSRHGPNNGHVFSDIAVRLAADGFQRSAQQCHTRVKRLKASYRQCRENLRVSGTDKIDFKFYDLLEQIVEKQPSTSTLPDAIEISEDSDSESVNDAATPPAPRAPPSGWTDAETLALMGVWGEAGVRRALRGAVHTGRVYAGVAEHMRRLGHGKSAEQCRWKVKALRAHYRQCCERKRSRRTQVDYKFYSQLEAILGQEGAAGEEVKEEDEEEDQDAAGANGAASGPWLEPETVALIRLWAADDVQESLRACVHNSHIYGDIANNMASLGHPRSAEQCQARMKNLKKTYRSFCNSRRSRGHPMLFAYYQLMEPVLGDATPGPPPASDPAAGDLTLASLLDPDDDLGELASQESSRKLPWSERETETLLAVWGEDGVQVTLAAGGRTRHLYDYISQKMRGLGFARSPEQCYTRLKRLRSAFQHDKKDFKYFDQMEQIYNRVMSVDEEGEEGEGEEEEEEDDDDLLLTGEMLPDLPDMDQDIAALLPAVDGVKQAWGEEETELLLQLWGSEEIRHELRASNKTKPALTQVSRALEVQGFHRTAQQCQTRIKRLKRTFRRFLEDSRGGAEKQECKYFDQLLRVFGAQYLDADPLANSTMDMTASPESSGVPSP